MLTVADNAVVVPRAPSPTLSELGLEHAVEDGRINPGDQASQQPSVFSARLVPAGTGHLIHPPRSLPQAIIAPKPRGGAVAAFGQPDWNKVSVAVNLSNEHVDMISAPLTDIKILDMITIYPMLKESLTGLEHGGGGFALAGSPAVSRLSGDITFKLRCKSHNAFKCPAAARIVYRKASSTFHIESASGWKHVHSGDLHTNTGLPPNIKHIVDSIVVANPAIKCRALKNLLWEAHGVPKAQFDSQIDAYYYRGSAARRQSLDVTTGISSFGTVQAFAEGNGLFEKLPLHVVAMNSGYLDMAGVIGHYIIQDRNRCLVLFSSAKLLLDTYLQSGMGFSNGQLHTDFTFKLLQEQIPFLVMTVPDVQQHTHLVTLGPCTHKDKEMLKQAFMIVKNSVTKIVKIVLQGSTGVWPADYSANLKAALATYVPHIVAAVMKRDPAGEPELGRAIYYPGSIMADADLAVPEPAKEVFDEVDLVILMCWVHVWRAVKAKHYLLYRNTEERQTMLYDDLNYIHNVANVRHLSPSDDPESLVHLAMNKFNDKWAKLGEERMVGYIKDEWFAKHPNWQRARLAPGEPSDNNTLESFNRTLKTDSAFGKTTSLGLCLTACLTVVHRTSRDTKSIFLITHPIVKKKLWVSAQKLVSKSLFKLTYKAGNTIIVPSEGLLQRLPGTTVAERRQNISIWVKEFVALMKNPSGYHKAVGDNSWDFDTFMDYVNSFHVVAPVPCDHPQCTAMARVGIIKECTCPQYMHYVACKHALGLAIEQDNMAVPTSFSTQIVGKRAASPGAKSGKRSKCLALDY